MIDGIGPTYRPTGRRHPRHQHQSGTVESIWAAINHTSAAIYGYRADSPSADDLPRYLTDFTSRARRPGRASPLLRAVAGALGTLLLVHAFFHRSAINSLTYAARCAPSFIDSCCTPSVPVAPVWIHTQGGFGSAYSHMQGDPTWSGPTPHSISAAQAGSWWREHTAQAA